MPCGSMHARSCSPCLDFFLENQKLAVRIPMLLKNIEILGFPDKSLGRVYENFGEPYHKFHNKSIIVKYM